MQTKFLRLEVSSDIIGDESAARILKRLGLEIREIDREFAAKLGQREPGGIAVVKTDPGGIVAKDGLKWGLKCGDIILQVNDTDISTLTDVEKILSSHTPDMPVRFLVRRTGILRYLAFRFD